MSSTLQQVLTFIKVVRYPNLLIMAATQVMCYIFLTHEIFTYSLNPSFVLAMAATLLVAAGGYIINDIFDEAADVVNKPGKAYIHPGNRNFYGMAYYSITVAGVACGLLASAPVGIITVLMAALLYFYSYRLKKMLVWGNVAVALMSAMAVVVLLFVLPGQAGLYLTYAGFAFVTTLVREMVKDIEDTEGDRAAGYTTLPVVKGVKVAQHATVAAALIQVVLVLVWAMFCLFNFQLLAFYYIAVLVFMPSVVLIWFIHRAKGKRQYGHASLLCKLIMLAGIASMIFT